MKIILPLEGDNGMESRISDHFGQAPVWGIYNIESRQLVTQPNTSQHGGGGCQAVSEVVSYKPDMLYTLGMGVNAIEKCRAQGVQVKSGTYQTVREVIDHIDELADMTGGCAGSHGDNYH